MTSPTEKQVAFIQSLANRILVAKAPAKVGKFSNPIILLATRQSQARDALADLASGALSTSLGASRRIDELLVAAKSVGA